MICRTAHLAARKTAAWAATTGSGRSRSSPRRTGSAFSMSQSSIRSEPEKAMNYNIEFKNFTPQKKIQERIKKLMGKMEKKAQPFSPDTRNLRLILEENSSPKLYRSSTTLKFPQKTLATKEKRH